MDLPSTKCFLLGSATIDELANSCEEVKLLALHTLLPG